MLTGVLQKLIILIIGLIFAASVTVIFLRSKNTNRTECTQIFKTAEYFNAWIILVCFVQRVEILHITERIFLVNLMKRLKQYRKK